MPRPFRLPRWTALILWPVLIPALHAGIPWALSLLGTRYGWASGRPRGGNLLGLPLVAAGLLCLVECLALHFIRCPRVVEVSWTRPPYLLREGPYRRSRNPMYVAALAIWAGWALFYGSVPVLIATIVLALFLRMFLVPLEERALEAHYGDVYREYARAVPRWLGKYRR